MSSFHSPWQKYATFSLIALMLIFSTFGIVWIWWFGNPLDPMRLRLTKRCSGCRFEFSSASFSKADLAGADLSYANLSRVKFNHAQLEKANLSFARTNPGVPMTLQEANLSGANIRKAALPSVNLANADLSNANLQDSDLIYADLTGANLQNANLTGVRLTRATLLNANFKGANLSHAKLCFVSTLPSSLKDATLTGALITGLEKGFTPEQKQALENRGAITDGASERCF